MASSGSRAIDAGARVSETPREVEFIKPGQFEAERHYYPRTLNAQIHPLVQSFFGMSLEARISRYCHLHPFVDQAHLWSVLTTRPRFFHWSGSDLFNVSGENGVRLKLIVETNSCPSGQKSFPSLDPHSEEGGYQRLIERTFLPLMQKHLPRTEEDGVLAVLYDKNYTEASGYAQVLANQTRLPVYLTPYLRSDPEANVAVDDRRLFLKLGGERVPVACALRYVTQAPWTRLPFNLKTPLMNPIVTCLAGGRNKASAARAYELWNAEHRAAGLEIRTPQSFTNVRKAQVPLLLRQFGGRAVVKVPYLNAGQGIYTIVDDEELEAFMQEQHAYDEFIVQQLVGNFRWSSVGSRGRVFNIGTVPGKLGRIYVFDLRMMVSWQETAYAPVAMYARRARKPMETELQKGERSWEVLGTNLSTKLGDDQWDTEPQRLLMLDQKDFDKLGLGLDDLIECYVQTVMANAAIDELAQRLVKRQGGLRRELFRSLSNDEALLREIRED